MLSLNWPLVILTTVVLYILIILTLPFSTVYATVFLFTLIGFWSRMPGVGIVHPGLFLYMADLLDVFTIIIALNLGGPAGAVFALFTNMWSRLCGIFPTWLGVTKDSIAQAIVALIVPVIYGLTGGNLVYVAIWYTIIREIVFFFESLILPHNSWGEYIFNEVVILSSLIVINSLYMKLFGTFFDKLLEKGVVFSWVLFLFATVIILIFAIVVFGFSPKKATKKVGRNLIRAVKRHRRRREHARREHAPNHQDLQRDQKDLEEMRRFRDSL